MKLNFIEPELKTPNSEECQSASYLRREFVVSENVKKAVLYMTALGVYEGYLNGKRINEELLRPGYTNYHARLQYQTYDVTEYLSVGLNVLGAILADGWYRGCCGAANDRCVYGNKTALAARLEIFYADGSMETVETDESWKATQQGPYIFADLKTDEYYDATQEMTGWCEANYDVSGWHDCFPGNYDGKVVPQEGEKLIFHEAFSAKVLTTPNGEKILDFGQNHSGMVEFTVTGKAGTKVRLTLGETLDENGNFTTKNLIPQGTKDAVNKLGQRLTYVLKEGTQTYCGRFLVSGYRYAKPEGWPEELKEENFISHALYSDLKETGNFTCSDESVNRLYQNTVWSMKSNFVDIPTDCPQRERAGWTGDINVFSGTACYMADTKGFLRKWLHDFLTLQWEDGNLPYIVPEVPMGDICRGSAGWSDALINIPMVLYERYGDMETIREVYDAAKRYVDFDLKRAEKKHIFHLFKGAPHYKYILDTGYHYGEWMEPGKNLFREGLKGLLCPDAEVATAWLYHSVKQVARMAALLHAEQDEKKYKELAEKIADAYQKEFLKEGRMSSHRLCKYVRPLYMELAEEKDRHHIAAELNRKCVENNYRIGTGFLTTYRLLPVLCEYGYADTAYRILENKECPGWLYEVEKGATTMWENWMGIDELGVPRDSLNHYAPGSVAEWFYAYCGGIRPLLPGFKKVRIKPYPGGSLTWVKCCYESIQGKIVSDWKMEDGMFYLHVEIPQGMGAIVELPDGTEHHMDEQTEENKQDFSCVCKNK